MKKESLEWWTVKWVILKKTIWLKKVKKCTDEVIKYSEFINNSLNSKI